MFRLLTLFFLTIFFSARRFAIPGTPFKKMKDVVITDPTNSLFYHTPAIHLQGIADNIIGVIAYLMVRASKVLRAETRALRQPGYLDFSDNPVIR